MTPLTTPLEDKAREVLAAHLDVAYSKELCLRGNESLLVLDRVAVAAMLTFADMRLDEAAGVARAWNGTTRDGDTHHIATAIEALKDTQ